MHGSTDGGSAPSHVPAPDISTSHHHHHSSTDNGLTPSYAPAPEINQSHHHHHHHRHHHHHQDDQINYGTIDTINTNPPPYKATNSNLPPNEREEDHPNTLVHTISVTFRLVFVVIVFAGIFAIFTAHRSQEPDYTPPYQPWPPQPSPQPHRSIQERVKSILLSTPLIDGHDDLAIFIRGRYHNDISNGSFKDEFENGDMPLNVDIPRLKAGLNGGAFWSAFVACPINASYDMSDANYAVEVSHTLQQIDLLRRLQNQYSNVFVSPTRDYVTGSGRSHMLDRWHYYKEFFGPISIEGLHQVLPSAPMSTLRQYYALGVRMATLTWNCHNPFADAAIVMNSFQEPPQVVNKVFREKEGAITNRGLDVLREMNRIGMIIDISHTSYWTQKAVLGGRKGEKVIRAPVVFSHSSAYALCPHPRNVRDEILDLVPETRSLVMVNFSPDFISCTAAVDGTEGSEPYFALPKFYEKNNTLHQVARHIKYIGDRIGYEYVGIGSDFDGMGSLTPKGLEGVDKFPDLVAELLRMGISDESARAVVGGNILRVWKEVDDVSEQMQKAGVLPGLDDGSGY